MNKTIEWEYCDIPTCGFCGHNYTATITNSVETDNDANQNDFVTNSVSPYGYESTCERTCSNNDECPKEESCLYDTDCIYWSKRVTYEPPILEGDDEKDDNWRPISMSCGDKFIGQSNYRGPMNVTINGYTCQAWNAQFPHTHLITPDHYPFSGLDQNYCRYVLTQEDLCQR